MIHKVKKKSKLKYLSRFVHTFIWNFIEIKVENDLYKRAYIEVTLPYITKYTSKPIQKYLNYSIHVVKWKNVVFYMPIPGIPRIYDRILN